MSNNTTISATYKFEEAGDGLKKLTESADAVRKVMKDTLVQAERTNSSLSKIFQAINIRAINDSFSRLQSGMKSLTDAYAAQEQAETQLETVMRQRMSATEEQIQSIKDLCSAQQEIGVIGDEVQLAGAQQVATFLKEKSSLETLIPAMNNLIAQQKGLNASGTDAVSVANLMGKAMQGQISALKRVGITFDDARTLHTSAVRHLIAVKIRPHPSDHIHHILPAQTLAPAQKHLLPTLEVDDTCPLQHLLIMTPLLRRARRAPKKKPQFLLPAQRTRIRPPVTARSHLTAKIKFQIQTVTAVHELAAQELRVITLHPLDQIRAIGTNKKIRHNTKTIKK